MVNNIAANVLGGASELEGELERGGTHSLQNPKTNILHVFFFFLFFQCNKANLVSGT